MAKKKNMLAFGGAGLLAVVAIVFVVLLLTGTLKNPFESQSTIQADKELDASAEFCDDNPGLDLKWRIVDQLSSSASYDYGTLYVAELDNNGNVVALTSATGGNVSTYTSSTNAIACGRDHKLFVQTSQDGLNAIAEPVAVDSSELRDPIIKNIKGTEHSNMRARVYDLQNVAFMYDSSDASNTDWDNLAVTAKSTTDNATATAVGADETLSVRLEVKTTTADEQFGAKTIVCVDNADDSNTNDWQEPVITFKGAVLSDMKASLSSNDQLALTAYEYCYDLGIAIGESQANIEVEITTGGGVNADDDLVFKFVGSGVYEDDDNPGQLIGLEGNTFFRTDSSRTELSTATAQTITIDVS